MFLVAFVGTLLSIVSEPIITADTVKYSSAAAFFRGGSISGKSRAYYMYTDNQQPMTDYFGLSVGAGIGYKTPQFKGFQAGMSGYFIANVASSDFTELDPITQNPSRYELGLFDVTDPANKKLIDRLEDLWVRYSGNKFEVKYGQFVPENLFINAQDGRMSPTYVRGLTAHWQLAAKHQLSGNIWTKVSPRSTVKWYDVQESIGIYPVGKAISGGAAAYAGKVPATSILIPEWRANWSNRLQSLVGSIIVPQVFQTHYLQATWRNKTWQFGQLVVFQPKGSKQPNLRAEEYYRGTEEETWVVSSKVVRVFGKTSVDVNYARIGKNGRFLMPREWGREPLYTFLPRERSEGVADMNAATVSVTHKLNKQFTLQVSEGYYHLPSPLQAAKNKYAMPSYNQVNFQLDYIFDKWFKGLSVRTLYIRKDLADAAFKNNNKLLFNKVNLNLINVITNFNF